MGFLKYPEKGAYQNWENWEIVLQSIFMMMRLDSQHFLIYLKAVSMFPRVYLKPFKASHENETFAPDPLTGARGRVLVFVRSFVLFWFQPRISLIVIPLRVRSWFSSNWKLDLELLIVFSLARRLPRLSPRNITRKYWSANPPQNLLFGPWLPV